VNTTFHRHAETYPRFRRRIEGTKKRSCRTRPPAAAEALRRVRLAHWREPYYLGSIFDSSTF